MKKLFISFNIFFLATLTAFTQTISISPAISTGLLELKNYQTSPTLVSFSADGTVNAPAATTVGRAILSLTSRGYTGSAYSSFPVAKIDFRAEQLFTSAAQGTSIRFSTTALGASVPSERMIIASNGNVGIGTSTPNAPLQFDNNYTAPRKIVLFEQANNDNEFVGFGVGPGFLRYQLPNTNDAHRFYAGTSPTSSNELMRIQGNGRVGIGTITPATTLEINGFSKLGSDAPAIKVKKLTGTTASIAFAAVHTAHGLDFNKIISVTLLITTDDGTYKIPAGYNHIAGFQIDFDITATNFSVYTSTSNSANVFSKPFVAMITYEE